MHIDDAPRGLHRGCHPHGNPKRTGNALRHGRYTADATTSNQEDELRQAAERAGWQVAKSTRITASAALKGVMDGRPSMRSVATPPSGNSML